MEWVSVLSVFAIYFCLEDDVDWPFYFILLSVGFIAYMWQQFVSAKLYQIVLDDLEHKLILRFKNRLSTQYDQHIGFEVSSIEYKISRPLKFIRSEGVNVTIFKKDYVEHNIKAHVDGFSNDVLLSFIEEAKSYGIPVKLIT